MKKLLSFLLTMLFLVPAHAEEPILRHLTTPDGLTLTWYDGPSSAISTSETFLHGYYIDEDWEAGYALNLLLAEAGNTSAMLRLGDHHLSGLGVPQDGATALIWYQRALEAGELTAHRSIALVYLNGWDVVPDASLAVWHMTQLAEQTGIGALELAQLHLLGCGNLAPDTENALHWFDLSVEDELSFSKTHHSAEVYQARYDQKKEAFLATQALPDTLATRPSPVMWADDVPHASDAMDMGIFWRDGSGGVANPPEAVRWFEKAIEMDTPATFVSEWSHLALGDLYSDGSLGISDISKAISHYAYANEFSRIGEMFRNGLTNTDGSTLLSPDAALADAFDAIGKSQDNPQAYRIIGDLFRHGMAQSGNTIIEADSNLAASFYFMGSNENDCAIQLTEMYRQGFITDPMLLYRLGHDLPYMEGANSELILLLASDLIHGRVTPWLPNDTMTPADLGVRLLEHALQMGKLANPQAAQDLLALISPEE